MSTVEIAELTGKQHRNVLRDARKMLAELTGSNLSAFESTYIDQKGEVRPCLLLPWRETMILITGYSSSVCRPIPSWLSFELPDHPRQFDARVSVVSQDEFGKDPFNRPPRLQVLTG